MPLLNKLGLLNSSSRTCPTDCFEPNVTPSVVSGYSVVIGGRLSPFDGFLKRILKPLKIFLIIILLGILISYVSNQSFSVLRTEITDLRDQVQVLQKDLKSVVMKKIDVEKQLTDISSTMPVLKSMASELRDGVKALNYGKEKIKSNSVRLLLNEKHLKENYLPDADSMYIKENLRKVVQQELEQFSADKTGKTDFALESSGGSIISTRDTESYEGSGPSLSLFGIPLCQSSNSPRALIQPGVMPGECWAFKGCQGIAVIQLINKIYVSGVSLEHIPRTISPTGETTTAPKEFSIWGLESATDTEGFFFGQFKYDLDGPSVQYFPVVHRSKRQFEIIELRVHSNHGHPEYTCIYRLRVHGDLKYNADRPEL